MRELLNDKQIMHWHLGTALFFAGVILVGAWLLKGTAMASYWTSIVILVWMIPFTALSAAPACQRRRA
ncbi:MAG: hypothetical protein R3E96_02025 [Planctomycetota bacterium]